MAQQVQVIDYHDFTDRTTARKERRRLHVGDVWLNAARCLGCGDVVRSRNRHDYVRCSCGAVAVDGGSWYAKRSIAPGAEYEELAQPYADVVLEP